MNTLQIAIIDPVGKKAGLDHYDYFLAQALIRKSCRVKVYSNFENVGSDFVENHFSFKQHNYISGFFGLLPEYISALRREKSDNTEIIILHIFHASLVDYLFIRLAKYFGFFVCAIVHDAESLIQTRSKSWISKCYDLTDYMVVQNEWTYIELIRKISGKNKKKLYIIPHGNFIDLPQKISREKAADYFNLNPGKKYLLFFGMIKKSKGLEVLIEAMKNVNPETELIIAGRTRDVSFSGYETIIKKLNLANRIHSYIRYISNEERNILFSLSDAVVLPYHRIYQSGVMLMAMSNEVPVIASDLPANEKMIGDKNGILFKAGNSADLALKINSIISDPLRKKSITQNAREYVATNHSWDKIGDEYINVLKYK